MGKARIMLVDDESVLRIDMREMLLLEGYDVVAEASNGEAAIEQAFAHRPDLIIMDVKMPHMDGLTAGRIIYQKTRIPILVLTAYHQSQLIDDAKAAGIIGYLVKPVTEADLVPAIEMALAQAERLRCLTEEKCVLEAQLQERKLIERAKGLLMQQQGLNEAEAYQRMRRQAMNRQMTLASTAMTILNECQVDGR
ncbi:response regulator [Alicyclobacillus cycloheptanicus]|uniref:Response regulator NasT n=1 Tax=Alicyclobacillus cycloheptanicus TaxID=1457 RepID=A0ABT9XGU5_9BACL|nr:response regulator [Alicyclobacillus cycloheptanicus]MDQ0189495.1 response regulator NasT [Alicyclobacillus cycloheptanicus]WDM01559.1 response regulator [Alicyclobacillus cycloheptanicus]